MELHDRVLVRVRVGAAPAADADLAELVRVRVDDEDAEVVGGLGSELVALRLARAVHRVGARDRDRGGVDRVARVRRRVVGVRDLLLVREVEVRGDEAEEAPALVRAEVPRSGLVSRVRVSVHEAALERTGGAAARDAADLLLGAVRDHSHHRVLGREIGVEEVAGDVVELPGVVDAVLGLGARGAVVEAHARDAHVGAARGEEPAEVEVEGVAREAARRVAELRVGEVAVVGDADTARPRGRGGRVEVRLDVGPRLVRHVHVGAVERIVALVVAVDREERDVRREVPVEHRLHVPDLVRVLGLREAAVLRAAVVDRRRREVAAVDDGVEPRVRRHHAQEADRLLRLREAARRTVPVGRVRIRGGVVAGDALALVDVGDHRERDVLARARRGIHGVRLVDLGQDVREQLALEHGDVVAERRARQDEQGRQNGCLRFHRCCLPCCFVVSTGRR